MALSTTDFYTSKNMLGYEYIQLYQLHLIYKIINIQILVSPRYNTSVNTLTTNLQHKIYLKEGNAKSTRLGKTR